LLLIKLLPEKIYLSVCISKYLSIYLSVYLSIYLSIYLPACVPISFFPRTYLILPAYLSHSSHVFIFLFFSLSLLLSSPLTWCVCTAFLSRFISFYLSVYSFFFSPATLGASYIFLCWPRARLPVRAGVSSWGITFHLTRFAFIHPFNEKSNQADPI
jgi:hypothetical protein